MIGLQTKDITIWEKVSQDSWYGDTWEKKEYKGNYVEKVTKALNRLNEEVASFAMLTIFTEDIIDIKEKDYKLLIGTTAEANPPVNSRDIISVSSCQTIRDNRAGKVVGKWLIKI